MGILADASLQGVFSTALDGVKTDFLGYVAIALPVGLAIAGVFIVVKLAFKFFKGVAK